MSSSISVCVRGCSPAGLHHLQPARDGSETRTSQAPKISSTSLSISADEMEPPAPSTVTIKGPSGSSPTPVPRGSIRGRRTRLVWPAICVCMTRY